MKINFTLAILILFCISAKSQTAISAVTTNATTSPGSFSYTDGTNTYNWGLSPYNTTVLINDLTAGGITYSYDAALSGSVKLRRVNNAMTTGNFTNEWSQGNLMGSVINLYTAYDNNMETFLNTRTYNKGVDNFFDNIAGNSNNIERMDYLLAAGYSTALPAEVGVPVFDRGDVGGHDPFVIAVVTSVDGSNNPASYGNIVRVSASSYGDPGPNVSYRILKAPYPDNLVEVGSNTQSRGGVFLTLQDLGIAANQMIYGYSILANDLPVSATPANLVDFNNATFYPLNTGFSGGIDMVAVTGFFATTTALPTKFTGFSAINNSGNIKLNWSVANDNTVDHYEIQRSVDGNRFSSWQSVQSAGTSAGSKSYSATDDLTAVSSDLLYYRIIMFDKDGSISYSKIVAVKIAGSKSVVVMYPNPVLQNLYLNINNASSNLASIVVTNALGKKILIQRENLFSGNNSISIDGVERLSKGIYFLSVVTDSGKRITRKFTKE